MNFRPPAEEPEINLIPFIDVLLVILIFLMLTTTYSKFTELQVTLPTATPRRCATVRRRSSWPWRPTAAMPSTQPLLVHRRTGAPVAIGADRVAAVQALCRRHPEVDIVVSDDGLQHHRLARQAQVLVFDERGAGNGLCLPAGPLRQPLPATVPESTVVLYSAGIASTALPGFLGRRRLAGVLPLEAWRRRDAPDPRIAHALRGRKLLAVAGIAAPQRFFDMLQSAGLAFEALPLADHHHFSTLPWPDDSDLHVVLTEKDAVKLGGSQTSKAHVWVAPLDFEPDPGFTDAIDRLLPPPPSR
jgi:tetraacyldisaccharide 4'-kinase